MTQSSLDLVARDYLWEYSPKDALVQAAERAENIIPWLIVEEKDAVLYFSHGAYGDFAVLPLTEKNLDVRSELLTIKQIIIDTGYPIPGDIDLDVELLRGFMDDLDRYSTVMYKDSLERFNERIQGQLTGIGCRVQKVEEGIRIAEVFPESPAERGGIQEDDIITHIDQSSIKGLALNDAVDRLRGPIHTEVTLRLWREENSFDVSLHRDRVRIPNVRLHIKENVAQIIIENFSSQTMRGVNRSLKTIRNTKGIKGIVLDLRGNTGGSMLQSCKTVDAFLDEGLVLRTSGKNGKSVPRLRNSYHASKGNDLDLPLIVLINSRSASASEIVSGALSLHRRAFLIGQKSHGKGVVQMPHTVRTKPDKVKIKLTVAEYLLKEDYSVHTQKGVYPDLWLNSYRFNEDGFQARFRVPEGHEEIPTFLYADEQSGWRSGADIRDDYPLEFARKILQHTSGPTYADIESALGAILQKEQESEKQRIQELFAAHDIDWNSGLSGDLQELEISYIHTPNLVAGEDFALDISVHNKGVEPIYQLYASFDSYFKGMPWKGEQIAIGKLDGGETRTITLKGEIPVGLTGRMEEIKMTLHSQGKLLEMAPEPIQIESVSTPSLLVRTQLAEEDKMRLQISVENLSDRDVQGLYMKLALPNTKDVELLSSAVIEKDRLEKGEVFSHQYSFLNQRALEDLSELKLVVKAENRSSHIEWVEKPELLRSEQQLMLPSISTSIPNVLSAGSNDIQVLVDDDGEIVESSLWVDGDKKGWKEGETSWSIPLELSLGRHRITIQAVDDSGLESHKTYYVDAVATP